MSNREKDPDDWVSGDEPMTGQASSLKTLSEQLVEPREFNQSLRKAEASKRIGRAQIKIGGSTRERIVPYMLRSAQH